MIRQRNRLIGILALIFTISAGIAGCTSKMTRNNLIENIENHFAEVEGDFAIAFLDLADNKQILINAEESFHAASTMKTPVMWEVFKQIEEGRLSLSDSVFLKNEFQSIVDSSLYSLSVNDDSEPQLYQKLGDSIALEQLIYQMVIASSNLATNIIVELVGAENITNSMRAIGARDILVLRGVEDMKAYRRGLSNTTTAADLMVIFQDIGMKGTLSAESYEQMLNILFDQEFNKMIPALLPNEVRVAHKTGWITGLHHDSGIVVLPDGKSYVLVLLSKNLTDEALGVKTLAEVSKIVYDYVLQKSAP